MVWCERLVCFQNSFPRLDQHWVDPQSPEIFVEDPAKPDTTIRCSKITMYQFATPLDLPADTRHYFLSFRMSKVVGRQRRCSSFSLQLSDVAASSPSAVSLRPVLCTALLLFARSWSEDWTRCARNRNLGDRMRTLKPQLRRIHLELSAPSTRHYLERR